MSYLFGHLNVSATEHGFIAKAGQELVFEAANEYIQRVNRDMQQAISAFVSTNTESFKERYKLPGGGHLQRRDADGRVRNIRANGQWDVAYPIEDFGAGLDINDVTLGYMTGQELSNHINTVVVQNANTVRFEILKRLFNNTQTTFTDPHHGALSIEPLANGDSVTYPPVLGSESEAAEDHYLGSSYAASSISDTNDPFVEIADELEEHFGAPTGGSNIVVFVNNAQTSKTRDLAAFTAVADMGISYGNDTSLSTVPPQLRAMSSAKILGRHDEAGCWIAEWRYIPANYVLGTHLDAEAPLKMRIDPSSTGLGSGLQMVNDSFDYPHQQIDWRHRFGVGASNRLNGVVKDMSNTDSDYDIPAAFA